MITGLTQGVINAGLILVAIGTMLTAIAYAWRYSRKMNHFLDDWFGEPGRVGQERRPGVMERLDTVEKNTATSALELRYNGGHSLKDAIRRIETTVDTIQTELGGNHRES